MRKSMLDILVDPVSKAPLQVEVRRYGFRGSSRALAPVRDVGWYLAALPLRAGLDGADVLHCPTHRAPIRSRVRIAGR